MAKGLWHRNGIGAPKKGEWIIKSATGQVQAKHLRKDLPNGKKKMPFDPPGISPKEMLYLAEQTRNVYSTAETVYVCEGEKAADAAVALGLQAVGTVGGASSCPSPEVLSCLDGFPVVLWPDYDEPGHKHMHEIAQAMGRRVSIVNIEALWNGQAPAGQDAADLPALPTEGLPLKRLQETGRRLISMKASEVEPKAVDWLVDGYIPKGMVTILAGDPDTGKSFLSLDWCASLSRSGGRSVYLVFEDAPEYTLVPRLLNMGADAPRVEFIAGKQEGENEAAFSTEDIDLLDDLLTEDPAELVVVDPIQAFTQPGVDVHRDNQVRSTMTPLAKLAAKHHCAVVIVMHLRKPPGSDKRTFVSLHDVRNSGDYVGAARSVLGVCYKSKDEFEEVRKVVHLKCNVAAHGPYFEFSIDNGGYHPLSVPRAGESGGKVLNMPARPADNQYAEETF